MHGRFILIALFCCKKIWYGKKKKKKKRKNITFYQRVETKMKKKSCCKSDVIKVIGRVLILHLLVFFYFLHLLQQQQKNVFFYTIFSAFRNIMHLNLDTPSRIVINFFLYIIFPILIQKKWEWIIFDRLRFSVQNPVQQSGSCVW